MQLVVRRIAARLLDSGSQVLHMGLNWARLIPAVSHYIPMLRMIVGVMLIACRTMPERWMGVSLNKIAFSIPPFKIGCAVSVLLFCLGTDRADYRVVYEWHVWSAVTIPVLCCLSETKRLQNLFERLNLPRG